jgi:hypothetical protein
LGVAGIGATALIYAVVGASADSSGPDPDQAITTNRLELAMPSQTRMEAVERKAEDAASLQSAVHPKPTPIQWAEGASSDTAAWAQPRLNGVAALAGKYEPRFDMHMVRKGDVEQAQLEVSLERKAAPREPIISRLGFVAATSPKVRQKGHWFLFAAGGSNAVGINLLNDPQGQLRRAGWSSEHVAAVGSGQLGIGWRRGPLQASFGAVQRELSAYGRTVNEKFLAFTLSFTPGAGGGTRPANSRAWMERDDTFAARRR